MRTRARIWLGRLGWLACGLFSIVATTAVAAVIAWMIAWHTQWGRDQLRDAVVAKLDDIFVGGATIGSIEGSPFDELVAHDVVIRAPDGSTAIAIGTVRVSVELAPLWDHEALIDRAIADDVSIEVERMTDGTLSITNLFVLGPPSEWRAWLPAVAIRHGHAVIHDIGIGGGDHTIDAITADGTIDAPRSGEIDGNLVIDATWREKRAPIDVALTFARDDTGIRVPIAVGRIGDVSLSAGVATIEPLAVTGVIPSSGVFGVTGSRAALAALGIDAPAGVAAIATVAPARDGVHVEATGFVDHSPMRADVAVDLVARAVRGRVTGENLAYDGARVASLRLDVDARGLPAEPAGTATLELRGVDRGTVQLDSFAIVATSRVDHAIDVRVRTKPKDRAWLADADAVVTPGHGATPTTIDIARHHLRVAGTDWNGTAGRISIGANGVAVSNLSSASELGALSLDGSFAHGRVLIDAKADIRDIGSARASIDIAGSTVRRADITATADLSRLAAVLGVARPITGRVDVTAHVSGANAVTATIETRVATAPGILARPVELHVTASVDNRGARADVMLATLRHRVIPVPLAIAHAELPLTIARLIEHPGAILDAPLAATVELPSEPAQQLLAAFGRSDIVGGTLDGKVTVAGTLVHPTATATLHASELTVPAAHGSAGRQVTRDVTVTAAWDGAIATADVTAHAADDGTLHLAARGSPAHLGDATLTLDAKHFEIRPLAAFVPGPAGAITGRVDGQLRTTGFDPRTAKLTGKLTITGARVPLAPTLGTLRDAKIEIGVDGGTATIAIAGKVGRGTVDVRGTIPLAGDRGHATIALRDVSPIAAIEPHIDADITADLRRSADRWDIALAVQHGVVRIPDDRGHPLDPQGLPEDVTIGAPPAVAPQPGPNAKHGKPGAKPQLPPPPHPTLVCTIDLGATRIESSDARGTIDGKLTLSFGASYAGSSTVGITGHVGASSGDLQVFGRRYQLDHADVQFDGGTDPLLDVRVTYDFPDVSTVTQLRGRLSKPELIMQSDPPSYSQDELLGFLLGGEPNSGPTQNQSSRVASSSTSFVGTQVSGYVNKALPVSVDVLDYESATATNSAALRVGTWITHELFLAYRRHLDARPDENGSEGEAEYWLMPRVSVQGTAGDRGYDGVDLLWRRRW